MVQNTDKTIFVFPDVLADFGIGVAKLRDDGLNNFLV